MDQLKNILGIVQRQHFWILSPILLISGIVGWSMATKKLQVEFDANKGKVGGYIQQMGTVSQTQPHPNDEYHQGMEQLIGDRRTNVRKAWETKWERQKQQLKWPDGLDPSFLRQVETMRPIEAVDSAKQSIPEPFRRRYQSFVKELLPKLAEKIDAKWAPANMGRAGGFGEGFGESRRTPPPTEGGEGLLEEESHLVEWDSANQGLIEQRFDWGASAPSTMEVLYAQEDVWVLSNLVDIIQRTNGNAIVRSQAAIKSILAIEIGKDVKPPSMIGFSVMVPTPLGGEEGEEGGGGDAGSAEPAAEPRGDLIENTGEATAGPTAQQLELELVKNRYYDENFEPIADKQTLVDNVTVAKRVPVRIRLQMDQRQINRLLVECANSPLTFEVRQLRFNPSGVPKPGFGGREGAIPSFTEGASPFAMNRQAARTLDDYQSFDRVVELFGIIYIFNPVNDALLNGEVSASPSTDSSAAILLIDQPQLAAR